MRSVLLFVALLIFLTAAHAFAEDLALAVRDEAHAAPAQAAADGPVHRLNASPAQYLPRGLLERYAIVIAIVMGFVAIGLQRRRPWALRCAEDVRGPRVRVRGYLQPLDRPGGLSPRPPIGLENPGLSSIKVGSGTPYMTYVKETVLEFEGTDDGSAPDMLVERGVIKVNGSPVTRWHLKSGDVIEVESFRFKYLRGHRR